MSFSLSNHLDYSITNLEDRKMKVYDILYDHQEFLYDYYDKHQKVHLTQNDRTSEYESVSQDLEKMADYLLYMDNKEQRDKEKKLNALSKTQLENRKKKEFSTDDFSFVDEKKGNIVKNTKVYERIKVYEHDRKQYKELADTGNMIKELKERIKTRKSAKGEDLSNEQVKKLRWFLIELGKDEVAIKEQLKKYISFKNIQPSIPYFDLTLFSFANPYHVKILFDNYQKLKEKTRYETDNDFKYLLMVFEDLVYQSTKEPILKMVFMLKINGYSQKEIIHEILWEFNIKISPVRLTQLTTQIIPNLISDCYKHDYENWIFTYKSKGNYKQCTSCQENKLANKKYFTKDTSRKDGLFPICKACRNKKNEG